MLDSPPLLLVEGAPLGLVRLVGGGVDLRHRRLVLDDVQRHHLHTLLVVL